MRRPWWRPAAPACSTASRRTDEAVEDRLVEDGLDQRGAAKAVDQPDLVGHQDGLAHHQGSHGGDHEARRPEPVVVGQQVGGEDDQVEGDEEIERRRQQVPEGSQHAAAGARRQGRRQAHMRPPSTTKFCAVTSRLSSAAEPQRHARDVGRMKLLLEALRLHQPGLGLGRQPELDLALGHDPARRDRVQPDPVGAEIAGEPARQADHRRLGGLVDGDGRLAVIQATELKLTIEPPPASFMPGATAWMAKNWWRRLTAMRSSQ